MQARPLLLLFAVSCGGAPFTSADLNLVDPADSARADLEAGPEADPAVAIDADAKSPNIEADTPIESGDPEASKPEPAPEAGSCSLVTHSDGVGDSFCDAVPLGHYNQALGSDACDAFVLSHPGYTCVLSAACPDGTSASSRSGCVTWIWGGDVAGYVRAAEHCECPTARDLPWR